MAESSKRIKATFRMDPENIAVLEAERLRRISAGVPRSRADLSDLVNEAIRRSFGEGDGIERRPRRGLGATGRKPAGRRR